MGSATLWGFNALYCIAQLVRALRLVNLAAVFYCKAHYIQKFAPIYDLRA